MTDKVIPMIDVRLGFTADTRDNPEVTRLAAAGWPDGWPVPEVGIPISLPNGTTLYVRAIDYFPFGEDDPDRRPFIYIVLGSTP